GWKFEGESYAPQLMTRTNDLDLAVDVSPAFDGKRIAFRVGEDSEYTLHFSSTEDGLYLRDLTTNDTVAIAAGNTYSFMAFNSVSEERFEIIARRNEIPSGWDEIKNDASFDILDMTVYTADGRLVLHRTNDFNKPLALPQNGTYIVYLTTTAGKHVHKIVF
ncbi:MAG: T9SS type A sorting domain-containing protein, partial [Paludibacteraceae bacterium]|nr:T9SS type A sorting domain-containing protein [Paludibacteraceae bacterium]